MQDGGHLGYGPKVGHGSNQLFGQLGFQQPGHLGRYSLTLQHHLVKTAVLALVQTKAFADLFFRRVAVVIFSIS